MQRIAAACLGWLLVATPPAAGPWLRDPSLSFVAVKTTLRADGTSELGAYAEHGLTDWLTLGVDVDDNGSSGHALVFARFPLRRDAWVASADLALGGHRYRSDTGAMARLLFGVGRNVRLGRAPGWAAVSLGPEWRQDAGGAAWKADAVLGLKADRRVNPILSVETYLAPNNDLYWSVIPGVTVGGKPGRTWLIGLDRKAGPDRTDTGLRIGLWLDF